MLLVAIPAVNSDQTRIFRHPVALAGPMPFALARRFAEGEQAALAIVAAEVRAKGACDLAVDAIAARADVWRYGGGERPPL